MRMFKEGQIVLAQGYGIMTFKITDLFKDGQFATIEAFSISKQALLRSPLVNVPTSTLVAFKEDPSQTTARKGNKRPKH
jgi:hypothetical protein